MPAVQVDDEPIVRAAERAVRRIVRGLYSGHERDDLLQEGRLAVWSARRGGRVPDDAEHARRYLARRARGQMIDAIRTATRQMPSDAAEWTPDMEIAAQTPGPDARLHALDALTTLRRNGSWRMVECVRLLAEGHERAQVAATLGVTPRRVSQLRLEAAALVALVGEW